MYPKPPKTLKTIQDPSLNKLFEAAACRGTEETRLLELLPEKLRETCRYGGFTDGELTLIVANSALATQIRYQHYEILQQLRTDGRYCNAWRVRTRVAPAHVQPRPATVKRFLSNKNARLLEEEAGHTKDEGLKKILLKLARHQS